MTRQINCLTRVRRLSTLDPTSSRPCFAVVLPRYHLNLRHQPLGLSQLGTRSLALLLRLLGLGGTLTVLICQRG